MNYKNNESNKFQLCIEFNAFKKKKFLLINLDENKNIEKNDLIKNILELKETIKTKDEIIKNNKEKIKSLENKLKQYRILAINILLYFVFSYI